MGGVIVGDYLMGIGVMLFGIVATIELVGKSRHIDLPKSALLALFFLMIGLAISVITGPNDDVLGRIAEVVSLRNFNLLADAAFLGIGSLVLYLAVTLNPSASDTPARIAALLGVACSALLLAIIIVHSFETSSMTGEGSTLYAIALTVNICVVGVFLYGWSVLEVDAEAVLSTSEHRAVIIAVLAELAAYLVFAGSFAIKLLSSHPIFTGEALQWSIVVAWVLFLAVGVVLTMTIALRYRRVSLPSGTEDEIAPDAAVRRQRALRRCVAGLCLSGLASGIILQIIAQLSVLWVL